MALDSSDHRAMLKGFEQAGFIRTQDASSPTNPIIVKWAVGGRTMSFRLWVFEITHGGGGATVRAADEFRIQITRGPTTRAALDENGHHDLLLGYSPGRDTIVAYDRRWLEEWTKKMENDRVAGSPSVQVKEADIIKGKEDGSHHLTKSAAFGVAHIVTLDPRMLPAYLLNHHKVLHGEMNAVAAQATVPSTAVDVVAYCKSRGFAFPPELLARYVAAFLTKPFVILAGVSGTGKSKMAELVAEYYSQVASPQSTTALNTAPAAATGSAYVFAAPPGTDKSRFALIAVRPDWIDNQSVLGFVNPITQSYESTQALDLILRASAAQAASHGAADTPRYFMLLDEMNLAKVEHYFSDWLAASESRRYVGGDSIAQQSIPLHRSTASLTAHIGASGLSAATSVSVPQDLVLPTNLVVTGTVNVDESTYGISPKVLDRAMVIEFDEVDLSQLRGQAGSLAAETFRLPTALPAFGLATTTDYRSLPEATHEHLKAINEILEQARLHFGYRSATEMARFMTIYKSFLPALAHTEEEWLRALDVAVLQKLLPRLQGNRAKLERMLVRLCSFLRDLSVPADLPATTMFERRAEADLPKSYARALEMLDSLRDFGFVSFFK